jgi:hypothetical protein
MFSRLLIAVSAIWKWSRKIHPKEPPPQYTDVQNVRLVALKNAGFSGKSFLVFGESVKCGVDSCMIFSRLILEEWKDMHDPQPKLKIYRLMLFSVNIVSWHCPQRAVIVPNAQYAPSSYRKRSGGQLHIQCRRRKYP